LIKFVRHIRTPSSECYHLEIDGRGRFLGQLDIHFSKTPEAYLILLPMFTREEIDEIVDYILTNIIDDDVYFSVSLGRLIFDFFTNEMSDYKDAKVYHLENVSKEIKKFTSKSQTMKGKLNEYQAANYLTSIGYSVEMATSQQDQLKIDLVASKEKTKLYAQVKSGQISTKEIKKVCENVKNHHIGPESIAIAIFAHNFNLTAEIKRGSFEDEYGIKLIYIHSYQLNEKHPQFKITS
jgi:Holliday junction resolvase-like predicted endonuclease